MNKDKIIKDLKKRNDSLKIQYEYRNIRCIHLEKENERLQQENEILKENAIHNDKVVDKVNWELQQLKKQKDDVVEYIKNNNLIYNHDCGEMFRNLLRMLGETDVED